MQAKHPPFAVVLVNLGTPSRPDVAAIRSYLKPFLWDRRVVDAPRWLWWFALNGIILRFRPSRIAKLYQSIWTPDGSPLLAFSQRLTARLEQELLECTGQAIPVHLAMTYGEPGLEQLGKLTRRHGQCPLIILPLFPQYSSSTTAAVFDGIAKQLRHCPDIPELHFVRHYHDHDAYIEALARSVEHHWKQHPRGEKLLFSFHGIPESYQQKGDPYPGECFTTARLVAARLCLHEDQYAVAFQSRFGRQEWVKPYADKLIEEWATTGIKHIDVICPGFATDCLETLEEIAMQNKERFIEHGGEQFNYIPCLNDTADHARALARIVLSRSVLSRTALSQMPALT